jgi:hypothetical protein
MGRTYTYGGQHRKIRARLFKEMIVTILVLNYLGDKSNGLN